jgi:UDP-N-acetyl-D-mannosaminuronate dehydrogenase
VRDLNSVHVPADLSRFVNSQQMRLDQIELAVVGLGYVGLPLAVAFGAKRSVTGFDISQARVSELQDGQDGTGEVSAEELTKARGLRFTSRLDDLRRCNCFIVAVPTPGGPPKEARLVGAAQRIQVGWVDPEKGRFGDL